MKKSTEHFSEQTTRELAHHYILDANNGLFAIVPSEEPVTPDNFAFIENGLIYTADDFYWYREDGSDRDLYWNDTNNFFIEDDLPPEIFCLLQTVICLKFAAQHLAEAKQKILEDTAKQELNKAITAFDETNESTKKLEIAMNALYDVSSSFEDCDEELYLHFSNSADVIENVLHDLSFKS